MAVTVRSACSMPHLPTLLDFDLSPKNQFNAEAAPWGNSSPVLILNLLELVEQNNVADVQEAAPRLRPGWVRNACAAFEQGKAYSHFENTHSIQKKESGQNNAQVKHNMSKHKQKPQIRRSEERNVKSILPKAKYLESLNAHGKTVKKAMVHKDLEQNPPSSSPSRLPRQEIKKIKIKKPKSLDLQKQTLSASLHDKNLLRTKRKVPTPKETTLDQTGSIISKVSLVDQTRSSKSKVSVIDLAGSCKSRVSLVDQTGSSKSRVSVVDQAGSCKSRGSLVDQTRSSKSRVSVVDQAGSCKSRGSLVDQTRSSKSRVSLVDQTGSSKSKVSLVDHTGSSKLKESVVDQAGSCISRGSFVAESHDKPCSKDAKRPPRKTARPVLENDHAITVAGHELPKKVDPSPHSSSKDEISLSSAPSDEITIGSGNEFKQSVVSFTLNKRHVVKEERRLNNALCQESFLPLSASRVVALSLCATQVVPDTLRFPRGQLEIEVVTNGQLTPNSSHMSVHENQIRSGLGAYPTSPKTSKELHGRESSNKGHHSMKKISVQDINCKDTVKISSGAIRNFTIYHGSVAVSIGASSNVTDGQNCVDGLLPDPQLETTVGQSAICHSARDEGSHEASCILLEETEFHHRGTDVAVIGKRLTIPRLKEKGKKVVSCSVNRQLSVHKYSQGLEAFQLIKDSCKLDTTTLKWENCKAYFTSYRHFSIPHPRFSTCCTLSISEQVEPEVDHVANLKTAFARKWSRPNDLLGRRSGLNLSKLGPLRYQLLTHPLVFYDFCETDESESESEEETDNGVVCYFSFIPTDIIAQIFHCLKTRDLAALKCTCMDFHWLINQFNISGIDTKWISGDDYRNDPCMHCGKIQDPRGDVSLCRRHPKIYYRYSHIGRCYWTCCNALDRATMGCQIGLHNNRWTTANFQPNFICKPWKSRAWYITANHELWFNKEHL